MYAIFRDYLVVIVVLRKPLIKSKEELGSKPGKYLQVLSKLYIKNCSGKV